MEHTFVARMTRAKLMLASVLIGGSIAFIPSLPWYRLGDSFQTASAILLLPGYLIDYAATGPHGMVIQRIVAMNCAIYPSLIYWLLRRRAKK